jgi:hypothetical protein
MVLPRRGTCHVAVCITNCDYGVLDWVMQKTGVGASVMRKARENVNCRLSYQWVCYSEAAESLLRQLLPYLQIKRRQAELAISVQERLRVPAEKADRSWQAEVVSISKGLNKRGA